MLPKLTLLAEAQDTDRSYWQRSEGEQQKGATGLGIARADSSVFRPLRPPNAAVRNTKKCPREKLPAAAQAEGNQSLYSKLNIHKLASFLSV